MQLVGDNVASVGYDEFPGTFDLAWAAHLWELIVSGNCLQDFVIDVYCGGWPISVDEVVDSDAILFRSPFPDEFQPLVP